MNLHKTNGIVLKVVKYGETSVIVSIFTEVFGIQSYLVNGVRAAAKKSQHKASLFQPGAILQLVVYHNELKNLQRIRESGWGHLYRQLFFDVVKNAVAMFIVEMLAKCLKQPEPGAAMYQFCEDLLIHLDQSDPAAAANYPLFFAIYLAIFLGIRIQDSYSSRQGLLDLEEGVFVRDRPAHNHFLEEPFSGLVAQFLKIMHPAELGQIKLNRETRRILIQALQNYYGLHVPDFGVLKTIPVLQTVLSG